MRIDNDESPAVPAAEADKRMPTVRMFNNVIRGLTYDTVIETLGSTQGTLRSNREEGNLKGATLYTWDLDDGRWIAEVYFRNEVVIHYAMYGKEFYGQ